MSVSSGRRAPSQIRDRIVGLRRVRADELIPNPKNWHRHPKAQADALRGLLGEIGYADALLARETPDGLMLIDGHLRAETTPTPKAAKTEEVLGFRRIPGGRAWCNACAAAFKVEAGTTPPTCPEGHTPA